MDPDEAHAVEQEWHYDKVVTPACNLLFKFPRPYPLQELHDTANQLVRATALRAMYSRRQLLEVMVEFWTDHFNIDQSKADCRWLKTIDDGEIRRHALGKFRDLLAVSAHSPAMLVYLDNATNRKFDPQSQTPPNENYARELLELHTLGDTSAYTLGDIQQVARCFTGWSVEGDWQLNAGRFVFRAEDHDDGEKQVLGQRIPPGQGQADGEMVIDLLASSSADRTDDQPKAVSLFCGRGGVGRPGRSSRRGVFANRWRRAGNADGTVFQRRVPHRFESADQTSLSLRDFGDACPGGSYFLPRTDRASRGHGPAPFCLGNARRLSDAVGDLGQQPHAAVAICHRTGSRRHRGNADRFFRTGAAVVAVGPGRGLSAFGPVAFGHRASGRNFGQFAVAGRAAIAARHFPNGWR